MKKLLLIFILIINSCASYQSSFTKGKTEFESKNYSKAIVLLEKHIQKKTNDIESLFLLARSYRKLNNFKKENIYYSKILEIEPDNYGSLINSALNDRRDGKHDQSLKKYLSVTKYYPKKVEGWIGAYSLLSNSKSKNYNLKESIPYGEKALELYNETNPKLYKQIKSNLGISYFLTGQKELAYQYLLETYNSGIRINRKDILKDLEIIK